MNTDPNIARINTHLREETAGAVSPMQDLSLHDECQWCGTGRLTVPDDDRCRSCIEEGITAPVQPLQIGHAAIDEQLRVMTTSARKQVIHNHRERNNPAWRLLDALERLR